MCLQPGSSTPSSRVSRHEINVPGPFQYDPPRTLLGTEGYEIDFPAYDSFSKESGVEELEDPLAAWAADNPSDEIFEAEDCEVEHDKRSHSNLKDHKHSPFQDLVELEEHILTSLFAREFDPMVYGACIRCNRDGAIASVRCRDCWEVPVHCKSCILAEHVHNPFHFVEEWIGDHFARTTLQSLGLVVYLGHKGAKCPFSDDFQTHSVRVVDANGIHSCTMGYCHCPGRTSKAIQLLDHGLFPASTKQPHTAFTFKVLKDFHIDTTCSRTTVYDYTRKLEWLTDPITSNHISSVYREFLSVSRLWRHLQAKKRSGQVHGISSYLPHCLSGQTSVLCPACPQSGINITAEELEKSDYGDALFLSIDGNFGLKRKRKMGQDNTESLSNGTAYFPKEKEFKKYLENITEDCDVSTCNTSKVVEEMYRKREGYDVTGIVSVVCSRHGFFLPRGTVDLQKGERYANVDFALAGALKSAQDVQKIFLSYDVACGYHKHIKERFQQHPEFQGLLPMLDRIIYLIPKLHIVGHKELCQILHSFNYTLGVGRTDGEAIERLWAQDNENIVSTREMGSGSRHDILNDQHSGLNFEKTISLVRNIGKKLRNAIQQAAQSSQELEELSWAYKDDVKNWEKMDTKPILVGSTVHSVYKVEKSAVPSQAEILQKIIASTAVEKITSDSQAVHQLGMATFINLGLNLESLSWQLRYAHVVDPTGFQENFKQYQVQFAAWEKLQQLYMPFALLPSALQKATYNQISEELVKIEGDLRGGQLNDILQKLQVTLRQKALLLNLKKSPQHNTGNKGTITRAQARVNRLSGLIFSYRNIYKQAQDALASLGLSHTLHGYPAITDKDLKIGPFAHYISTGRGYRKLSWIWKVGSQKKLQGDKFDKWNNEVNRVEWFECKANAARWSEQVHILQRELRRCFRSYGFYGDTWNKLGEQRGESLSEKGMRAYAFKKKAMFYRMQSNVKISSASDWFMY